MESSEPDPSDDTSMDAFLEKFQSQPYRGGFREDQWEEEFDKIPLFMKKAPSEIDPKEFPDLACLQSIIFDDERSPEGPEGLTPMESQIVLTNQEGSVISAPR